MVQCMSSVSGTASRNAWRRCRQRVAMVEKPVPVAATTHDTTYDLTVGNLVIRLVSILEKVDPNEIICTARGSTDACLARHIAMYLMHTVFSCPYHRVAAFFARDRTTISYACALIEDARDDKEFDNRLELMENLLVSARALYEMIEAEGKRDEH